MNKRIMAFASALGAALACVAVGAAVADLNAMQSAGINEAIAVINPASGSNCRGIVRFVQDGANLKVTADIEGLTPGAKHGFHIHEFGDCSAPDAMSAGSHFDPEMTKHHGMPHDQMRHGGDLGNLEADSNGKAHYEVTVVGTIFNSAAPTGVLGRGVVVHARPDDFGQPVGNAGGRIGCGVIGVMKPSSK